MRQPHPSKRYQAREQKEQKVQLDKKLRTDDDDGKASEGGYSSAIFALLRDPVSMGLAGANSNRGRQR